MPGIPSQDEVQSGLPPPDAPSRFDAYDLLVVLGLVWTFDLCLGVVGAAVGDGGGNASPVELVLLSLASAGWVVFVLVALVFVRYGGQPVTEGVRPSARKFAPIRRMLGLGGFNTAHALLGMCVGLVVGGGVVALSYLLPTGDSMMAELGRSRDGRIAITIIALLLPVMEELYYRGFLYPVLARYLPSGLAIAVVSVWFCAIHAFQTAGDWWVLVPIGLMGLVWTLQRHFTDSLWPSLVSHLAYNSTVIGANWILTAY